LVPKFELGLFNAWLLCVPLLIAGVWIAGTRRDVAKRMSDMTGYSAREKLFTVVASLAPYPFMLLTVWTPFTSTTGLLMAGIGLYLTGMGFFVSTIRAFSAAPPHQVILRGPYRLSRNPLYVSNALVFLGLCLVTANPVLLALLVALLIPQHFMILAEERACVRQYEASYLHYAKTIPRYLALRRPGQTQ
jgi:protein-S-isoprenylcysteine O-methyltransferase Ste14